MTRVELLTLVQNGENSGVEFKRDTLQPQDLAKEIVALANLRGGCVLLGVEDDGSVSGVTRPDLEEWVMNVCRDKIRPEIIPFYEIVRDVDPGKSVALVRIDPGWASAHCVWHNQRRSYYIRVGSTSREASETELARLYQQRGLFNLATRPVSGSTVRDLDLRRLTDYFNRIREQAAPETEGDWIKTLTNLELMAETEGGRSCTVAGLLLFGSNPNRFLPQAGIDAAAFPGTELDYNSVARQNLRGPMTPLLAASLPRQPARLVDNGAVENAVGFVRQVIPDSEVLEDGVRRERKEGFPSEVLREAVVNALVHRDYLLSGSQIQLLIFSNRIEIVSPGRLPNGITPERILAGCRADRNQLLKDFMRDYGYVEHLGMGVSRKVVTGMRSFNNTAPSLREESEQFRLILDR